MDVPPPPPSVDPPKRLTRILDTPDGVSQALLYSVSCVMPETTNWKIEDLPHWPRALDTWRILIVAGNVAHFAGDMPLLFWPQLLGCGHWEHIIYVPGPYDYGSGTLQLGDEYLAKLADFDARLTVFGPSCPCKGIYFTGPHLLVVGAQCFPIAPDVYKDARVFELYPGDLRHLDAVTEQHFVRVETAKARLAADVEMLLHMLDREHLYVWDRVVVTYGCPDEIMAASRKQSPFRSVVKLGDKRVYKRFADHRIRWWFCGAPTDKPVSKMTGTDTLLCSNCFMPGERKLPNTTVHFDSSLVK